MGFYETRAAYGRVAHNHSNSLFQTPYQRTKAKQVAVQATVITDRINNNKEDTSPLSCQVSLVPIIASVQPPPLL